MKFEKISENKLKVTLDYSEIPNNSDLEKFMEDSSNARETFLNILNIANYEVGFNTQDYKIKIDAKSLLNGDFVLFITKLVKLHSNVAAHTRKQVKPVLKNNIYSTYCFENFDDFCNFCKHLKLSSISPNATIAKSIQLYSYCKKYYLVLYLINTKYRKLSKFYTTITEFSKYYSSSKLFIATLREKASLVIDNSAIAICQKYFIK